MAKIAGHEQRVVVHVRAVAAVIAQQRRVMVHQLAGREVVAMFAVTVRHHHGVLVAGSMRHVEVRPLVRRGRRVARPRRPPRERPARRRVEAHAPELVR